MGKKILIGTLVFVGLLAGVIWLVLSATGEPVKVIRAHLGAINENDYPGAYSYLSISLQERLPLERFQSMIEEHSQVLKTRDSTFNSRTIENDRAIIQGTLTGQQGQVSPATYVLTKEGNQWRIRAFRVGNFGAAGPGYGQYLK